MAYCTICKVRGEYINGLCFECNERIGNRKSLPHGEIRYHKYSPGMSVSSKKKKRKKKSKKTTTA